MDNYKPNSHKSKDPEVKKEQQKIEKVITGTAKIKSKNEFQKFASSFIPEDIASVKSSITEALSFALKKALSEMGHNIIDAIIPGASSYIKGTKSTVSRIAYNRCFDKEDDRRPIDKYVPKSLFDYGDITLETRGEAEEVLHIMREIIKEYGLVRISDLYEMIGVPLDNYTGNNYGWMNLRTAEVVRVRDGFMLKLPRAIPLD